MGDLTGRLRAELESWTERLPSAWQPLFAGVELGFAALAPAFALGEDDRIWPQETNDGTVTEALGDSGPPIRWT